EARHAAEPLRKMIFALALVLAQLDGGAAAAEQEIASPGVPASDAPVAGAGAEELPAPPMTEAEQVAPSSGFVKGELSVYLGSDRLSVKRNRVGVSVGADFFLDAVYALVEPQIDLRFLDAKLGIGLGVPLRIEIFSFQD